MKSRALLLVTCVIWGLAFVAQRKAMETVPPFTFNAVRFLIGGLSLLPFALVYQRRDTHASHPTPRRATIWVGGLITGLALFAAASLQQIGMIYTTAGKAGFITGLYVVLVPILGLALGQRTGKWTWLGALATVIGLYLLTVTETLAIDYGDVLVIASAFFLTLHVLLIARFSARIGALRLSLLQFAVVVIGSFAVAFSFETISIAGLMAGSVPILYTGLLSVGVAYTFQAIGQRDTPPAQAAVLLSLESVFAVIGGWLLLGETLPLRGILGCGIIFAGMTVSQLDNTLNTYKGNPQ